MTFDFCFCFLFLYCIRLLDMSWLDVCEALQISLEHNKMMLHLNSNLTQFQVIMHINECIMQYVIMTFKCIGQLLNESW